MIAWRSGQAVHETSPKWFQANNLNAQTIDPICCDVNYACTIAACNRNGSRNLREGQSKVD